MNVKNQVDQIPGYGLNLTSVSLLNTNVVNIDSTGNNKKIAMLGVPVGRFWKQYANFIFNTYPVKNIIALSNIDSSL